MQQKLDELERRDKRKTKKIREKNIKEQKRIDLEMEVDAGVGHEDDSVPLFEMRSIETRKVFLFFFFFFFF